MSLVAPFFIGTRCIYTQNKQ